MKGRRVLIVSCLVLLLALAFSLAAVASPLAAPAAAPASESALVTAIGTATIPPPSTDFVMGPQTLNVSAQSNASSADVAAAVGEMQQRLLAIKAALEKLGVPPEGIRFVGLNAMPQLGPPQPGQPSPVEKGQPLPQQVTSFTVMGSLQADIPDVKLLVAAMDAATANGATGVNVGGGGKSPAAGTTRPDDTALAKGMNDAVANARAIAEAMASASGKKLGGVHSISANQLYPTCCPPQGGWNVQVTVSFDIAQ